MMRNSWLLTLFALLALATAFNLDQDLYTYGIEQYVRKGEKRQASGTGVTTPVPDPSSEAPTTPPNTPTPAPSPSPDPTTTAPGTSNTPSPSPNTSRQPTSTQPTSSNAPASSTPRSTAIVRTSFLVSTSLQEFTSVLTTESNGVPTEITSTGTNSVAVTTGQATVTDPPTSQDGDGNGSGLSDSNKKVIGGVVGGVGGALLLGGIALVFWRMKKRQNQVTADDDDLNLNTGAALGEKSHNGTGPSPFQSNLEQYHNPGVRPNAASNF